MGGACSRKRDRREDEDNINGIGGGGVSRRYGKSGSSKWLATSFIRPGGDNKGKCPSLLDLCVRKIREVKIKALELFLLTVVDMVKNVELCINIPDCLVSWQDISKHGTFSTLPRDITQQVFNELVFSQCLTETTLEAFRDCALQVSLRIESAFFFFSF